MTTHTDSHRNVAQKVPTRVNDQRERIIYLAPDCTDAAVKKRAHAFVGWGHQLRSFCFRRDRYDIGQQTDWPNVELGKSVERRLCGRILVCLRALKTIYGYRMDWRAATMIYARNLDLALLAVAGRWLTWSSAPLIYEVLDIHPLLAGTTARGALLRWIERRVLDLSRLLVVSSPAFVREYFRSRQAYMGNVLLLENKWSAETAFANRIVLIRQQPKVDSVWTIGWFGNLRCQASLDILTALADALPRQIRVYMRGCDSLLQDGLIASSARLRPNMVYDGEYSAPSDLPAIYSHIHFNWCVDLSDGDNSRWLIPNRIYEGGYFGVPALAVDGFETGRLVCERKLGVTITSPYVENLVNLFTTIDASRYRQLQDDIANLAVDEFIDHRDLAILFRQELNKA